jgi:hypothetical protein
LARSNGSIHRAYKSVSAARQSLDKSGCLSGIAQRFPKPIYRVVEAVVIIDKGVVGPQLSPDFFSRDHLSRTTEKNGEDLKRLIMQFDSGARLAQFSRAQVQFEDAEADNAIRRRGRRHEYSTPLVKKSTPPGSISLTSQRICERSGYKELPFQLLVAREILELSGIVRDPGA